MKFTSSISARRLALAAALAAAFVGPARADTKPDAGLSADLLVNGQPISENHVTLLSNSFGSNTSGQKAAVSPDARSAARAELITEELLAQEARKDGLDKTPAVEDQLAFQQREVLSRAYLENYFAKNPITDATLRAGYEFNRANGKIVEYKVRQILIQDPNQAAEILGRLNKGEDFATLAQRYTLDPGGQTNGGDLGWFRPDIFVDHNFTDAVVALNKGEYTRAPVRTRFGLHIIKVEEGPRPVANPEPYDALAENVKQAIRQRAAQTQIENLTARLTASAKITGPGATGRNPVARSSP